MTVKHFLMNHGMVENSRVPYPPCLIPANFFIFSKVKTILKGRFQDVEDPKNNISTALNAVPLDASETVQIAEKCKWYAAVTADYSEGKQNNFVLISCVSHRVPDCYCLTMCI
jgi:hypothetical protein